MTILCCIVGVSLLARVYNREAHGPMLYTTLYGGHDLYNDIHIQSGLTDYQL